MGIVLGFALVAPSHPLLHVELVISHHLQAADAGYCVVLYLWMLVGAPCCMDILISNVPGCMRAHLLLVGPPQYI